MDPARSRKRRTASAPTSCTSTNKLLTVLGGGPAGSMAALAALGEGAEVSIIERSKFPRHKVCGEFLSPEIAPVLEASGVLGRFLDLKPSTIRRMAVHVGRKSKQALLPEPAWGLSRYAFDHILYSEATARGAATTDCGDAADILASGRPGSGNPKGSRLFGFKAHFEGPTDDAVELYFSGDSYVGVNCVEDGITNVCGLAPERLLNEAGFDPDVLVTRCEPLRERLQPLTRRMKWIFTGPLEYGQRHEADTAWLAGDALSFVDPFTGSGLLCACLTGRLAGIHAARGISPRDHLAICRERIGRPYLFSSWLRFVASTSWAERVIPFIPSELLFRVTRPR